MQGCSVRRRRRDYDDDDFSKQKKENNIKHMLDILNFTINICFQKFTREGKVLFVLHFLLHIHLCTDVGQHV
jgi:hypothetical protein